jgi:hypothetical protein
MSEAAIPTCYELVVRGRLSERLASAFDGLTVESAEGQTVLSGRFLDQSQLHGVLDRLRALGIELVSVNAGC